MLSSNLTEQKLGVQRSELRDYIQKIVFRQNFEIFVPHCSITIVMHLVVGLDKFEHLDDFLGGVMRLLSRMKKKL